ncbi:hypothetical protein [Deinococcus wulumuqiensis]|uniref:Uncharacterized protein n=2 Tax=Deinococcus wulumuqiensis TaxID=980427 RepID=A0AAV4K8L7_9DEIO|nr:hypothetical protein [Deinococcus wulumuqiensis]GGI89885.1 hypothetical protein GCM10010914_25320 [Deinococcus wulumuqiensis]GGP30665.1 hypothetical protein GCM10008021_23160 [Deinococcus wulumuqiensis]
MWVALPGLLPAPSGCAPFPWLLQLTLPALAWRLPARDTAARRWRLLALGAPVWMVLSLVLYILLPDAPADTPLILAWPPLLLPWAALAWLAGRHEENPAAPISPAQLTVR